MKPSCDFILVNRKLDKISDDTKSLIQTDHIIVIKHKSKQLPVLVPINGDAQPTRKNNRRGKEVYVIILLYTGGP